MTKKARRMEIWQHRTNGHSAIVIGARGCKVRIEHISERSATRTLGTCRTMSLAMFRTFYRLAGS